MQLRGWRGAGAHHVLLDGRTILLKNNTRLNAQPGGSRRHHLERIDPKACEGENGRLCHAALPSRGWRRGALGHLVRTFERWQDYDYTAES
jgi:hypothetical protein